MGYPPNNPYLQIAVDGDDVVHAVWTTGPLRHATLTDDGWSSTDELTVDYCSSLCLGVDTDGHLQLLYDHGGLCIREWDGVLWTEERSVDFAPLSNPAIAADPWGNEHALWIAGPDGDRELYYSRRGTPLPAPEIQAVDPIEALAFGTQDLSVTGEHFLPPCVVTLEREGHASILGAILEATQDLVRSRFDLTGADPGSWSVILLAADGQRDTLANALTLTASPWGTEERISHAPESSSLAFNSGRSLVWGSDGRLHVFWYDRRDGNYEVYWSSGQQGDWSAETRLTNDPGGSVYPVAALAQTGPIVLAWQESRDGNWEIYSKTYQAGVWSTQQRLTTNAQPSQVPSLAADATGGVHLVWQDGRDGNPEVYYRRWSGSWEAGEVRLSHNSASSLYPTVVSDGLAKTYVAWMDDRSGDWEIYYRVHDGASWGDEIRLPQHAGGSFYPSLASDGNGRVVVVFEDDRDGNLEIYAQRIDEPSAPERLTNDPAASTSPALKLEEDGTQHLVWSDDRKDGIHQAWYKTYAQGEWSLDHRLSESPSGAELPMLAVAGGAAQVVWRDSRDGNYEIYGLFPGMLNPASAPGIEGASSDFVILWYPNPFEGQVTAMIHPAAGPAATLDLYDPSGRKIRSLLPGPAGGRAASTVVWDGRDDRGRSLGPGVYLYRLRIGERSESGSIVRAR
jgi:hypothetical protein